MSIKPKDKSTPSRVLLFPAWRSNPYLSMLTLIPRAEGIHFDDVTRLKPFLDLARSYSAGDVIHVNWTAPIFTGAKDLEHAKHRFDLFRNSLRAAHARGVTIIWTVHNVVAHDSPFPEEEQTLAQELSDLAHSVIVLNLATPQVVKDVYTIRPEKITSIPHSSYYGVYPDELSREEARDRMRLDLTIPTIAFVGQIRPYKGVDSFLSAAQSLNALYLGKLQVLLAGKIGSEDDWPLISKKLEGLNSRTSFEFVPDEELQVWFKAADVMVFPYESILNSGSVLLAATFGTPVVIPATQAFQSLYEGHDWVTMYPANLVGSAKIQAIQSAIEVALSKNDSEELALSESRRYTPYEMSIKYFELLDKLGVQ